MQAAAVCACLSMPANAQGVPTFDVTSIAKLTEMLTEARNQLQEQIRQNFILDEQTRQLLQQINLLEDQINALREGLTLEALGIGPDFLNEIMPGVSDLASNIEAARNMDWENFLEGTVAGMDAEDFVRDVFTGAGVTPERIEELANSDDPSQARIGGRANTSAFLSAAAEASAEDARESLERVDELVRKTQTTTGLKEAIDLNTSVPRLT
ncbi:type IV secretion system protein [uncultured Tateyamaria sp.]|uniref:type IV secretion system protein n=2 Tax=uncultured Tateyamaria sp. TaxID=455651 RepID=UPI002603B91E|nr:type IV secretion system protein [uncultured Tateyamaria sp.]